MRKRTNKTGTLPKVPLLIALFIGLIIIVLACVKAPALLERYTPSEERMELTDYYKITDNSQIAITLNHDVLDTYGISIDGHIYLDYKFVHDNLNSLFYWDANEHLLLYTTASDIITIKIDSASYTIGKTTNNYERTIAKINGDSVWIDIDFVKNYSDFIYTTYENPSRIVIYNAWEEITTATVKKDTQLRDKGGIKRPILKDIHQNDVVTILETDDKWTKVCTNDGVSGYILSKYVKDIKQTTPVSEFVPEQFSHIQVDKSINMIWHQLYGSSSGAQAINLLQNSKTVNVVSPTWFRISNNNGAISSIASHDYVAYCHEQGVQVWGLVTNVDSPNVDVISLLTHTSSRQNLINQLIAKAIEYRLDGINVDFEQMNEQQIGDAYIQFIRELSVRCEKNNIILSVDVPIPASYNDLYHYTELGLFADYVVVMAYDEHYGQKSGEGSVASLNWTEDAINNLLAEDVSANQIVFGIPFYTKLWNLTPTSTEESNNTSYIIGFENMGMDSARKWMNENVTEPVWLENCGQYYGECTKDGKIYKLWLEDATSLEKRLQLMKKYELGGAAFWKFGFENSSAWDVILKYFS